MESDYHVKNGRGDQTPLIYDSPVTGQIQTYTYRELLHETALFAGELVEKKDSGGFTSKLRELLEQSGFITSYRAYDKKKKDILYRLTDNYSLFYLKYINTLSKNEAGNWQSLSQIQFWKAWSGYASENICLQHIEQIKKGLGISGVHTRQFSFFEKGNDHSEGAQIDLLIDRMDHAISICEMKFYNEEYELTKEESEKLRRKRSVFRRVSHSKKQLFIVLITTFGIYSNKHILGLIEQILDMNTLFE